MKATFNAITYTGDKTQGASGFVKYRKISTIEKHIKFIERKYPEWRWITFFNRETNEKRIIKRPEYKTLAQNDNHFFLGQ